MSLFHRQSKAERFEALAAEHERMIYLLCLRMMGNEMDAQDCAQETLLSAYRAFEGFRGEADVKTWLYRIAYNTCLDALRKRKEHLSLDSLQEAGADFAADRSSQPEQAADRRELRRQIRQALAALPEDQRAVMILRDFQDTPYEEIARILEISEGTVKSRLSRAREKVKNYIKSAEQNGDLRVQGNEGRQK
ncbi:MAG: sigma-70 family RNA polymerase sigma factor [Clostridia bacterium]|nr:sigma-70 family RNA polymerase sigma factor [Clostridia bacterium]